MNSQQNVILIVDDTPENLRVLGELLEADGHEVRVATNGVQGLEIARSSAVDLVLLDIMMPGMDGYEVCKKLKRDQKTKELPIIFLTALDSADDEAKGLKLGAVDYITKPFKLELVRTRVENQLALHNVRQELKRHNEDLEALVAERSKALAAAHERLRNLDAAKHDFLQLIYQRLWAPGHGVIDISREALSVLARSGSPQADLQTRYEESQALLFDTINNALLLSDTVEADPGSSLPVRVDTVLADVLLKQAPAAQARGVVFQGPVGGTGVARGELDLIAQVLTTVVQAATLVAQPSSKVKVDLVEGEASLEIEMAIDAGIQEEELETLFRESLRFHPSSVGRALGLGLPLAIKIVRSLGGSLEMVPRGEGWGLHLSLPRHLKKRGARIAL